MKKVLVLCLALVMIISMNITAFATGGFVSSPSGNKAPEIVEGKNESEDCESELIITPFGDRNKLSEEKRKEIEQAYDSIAKNEDITKLNKDLANMAAANGVLGTDLAISDLFNMDHTDCKDHANHGSFKIKLQGDNLNNFFALMQFDGANWTLVENARIENGYLIFTSDKPSNFAIVVNKNANKSPQTGEGNSVFFWSTILVGSALAVVLLSLKKKRV